MSSNDFECAQEDLEPYKSLLCLRFLTDDQFSGGAASADARFSSIRDAFESNHSVSRPEIHENPPIFPYFPPFSASQIAESSFLVPRQTLCLPNSSSFDLFRP